jgi:hypothetical protein
VADDGEGEVSFRLSWGDAATAPVQPANFFLLQPAAPTDRGHVEEFVLTLGHAAPPVLGDLPAGDVSVPIVTVGRFNLSPSRVLELAELLGRAAAELIGQEDEGQVR